MAILLDLANSILFWTFESGQPLDKGQNIWIYIAPNMSFIRSSDQWYCNARDQQ